MPCKAAVVMIMHHATQCDVKTIEVHASQTQAFFTFLWQPSAVGAFAA